MPQKIFIGNNPLYLCRTDFVLPAEEALGLSSRSMTQENYSSENKLLELIENLENKKRQTAAVVFHDDEQKLFSEFKKIFSEISYQLSMKCLLSSLSL